MGTAYLIKRRLLLIYHERMYRNAGVILNKMLIANSSQLDCKLLNIK